MNCSGSSRGSSRGSIRKFLVETVAYNFTDIRLLFDSHSPYFFKKNRLQLLKEKALEMITKYGSTEVQSWP